MTINLHELRFTYEPALRLLVDDFNSVLSFVEPVDEHLSVHSHRLYELLLRTCTEFESLAKDALLSVGCSHPPSKMTMNDYRGLEQHIPLESLEVCLLMWRPRPVWVSPFRGWSNPKNSVAWYRDYNQVKHSRSKEFRRATLDNVRLALSALVALMLRAYVPDLIGVRQYVLSENGLEMQTVDLHPYKFFSIRFSK